MSLPSEDTISLRRLVSDLVSLTTLPALWKEYTPETIAENLSEVLLITLRLDLVYVHLNRTDTTIEVARSHWQLYIGEQATQIGNALDIRSNPNLIWSVTHPLESRTLWAAHMPIGWGGTRDFVVVGTQEMITENDLLLLRVAANQAAIALQQAQILLDLKTANEQKDILLAQEQHSRREAEEAIWARDEFLSVASHELRTPITSMRGFVELLLRQIDRHGSVNLEQLKRALQRIDEQSVKLSTLVSQLLDLSRIEAGRLTLELTLTNITLLVNTVASMMQKNTTRHLINVQTRSEVFAYIDALRLEQVLVNLLDNAIKYSPAGGPINLAVLTSDEQRVLISVTDKGLGIPLERRPYIFERFYQAHLEGYRGGMGLGLYISRQITELHAGTLEVEFPDEGGTRFVIFLPIGASPIDN